MMFIGLPENKQHNFCDMWGFPHFLTGALFISVLLCLGAPFQIDPDLWWHLKTGQWILERGIPHVDPFSWTALGKSWVTHEWLSEVLLWELYRCGGLAVVMGAFALLGAFVFFLVYQRCVGRPLINALISILAFASISFLWGPRPQVFSILMLAALLLILEKVRGNTVKTKWLYGIPFIFLLWANLHGGFLLGIVVLVIYALGDWLEGLLSNRCELLLCSAACKRLWLMIAFSIILLGVNPNGYHLLGYPFETLGSQPMQMHLMDWLAPDFHQPELWPFLFFLVLFLLSALLLKTSLTLSEIILVLGSFVASLMSVRHIPFFIVLTAPVISRAMACGPKIVTNFKRDMRFGSSVKKRNFFGSFLGGVCLALIAGWLLFDVVGRAEQYKNWIAREYPQKAVDFIDRSISHEKKMLNYYTWGGYLIWRGRQVFVDGRADLYGDRFLREYFSVNYVESGFEETLEKYKIDFLLFPSSHPLMHYLAGNMGWKTVYSDETAIVLSKEPS